WADLLWRRLESAPAGSENQKQFFAAFTLAASEEKHLNQLKRLLDGTQTFEGFVVDQDKRWELLTQLSEYKFPGVERLIELELKKDPSSMGQQAAMAARAAFPDWNAKKIWIDE